jgi:uncharacterized protein (DUF885 family)
MSTPSALLADELTSAIFDANPVAATLLGIRDRDDRLPDLSEAGDETFRAKVRDIAARAEEAATPGTHLGEDTVTLAVVRAHARVELDQLDARAVEYTVTDTFHAPAFGLLMMLPMTPLTEPAHADGYLARLAGIPAVLEATAERHRAGLAAGRTPVRRLADAAVAYLGRVLADPDGDPLHRPQPPDNGSPGASTFVERRDRLINEVVHPALARYRDLLATEVAPRGRPDERAGACWLPEGDEIYFRLVRAHTTTGRTPDELHQIGIDLVAELRDEYSMIGSRAFGTADTSTIFDRLRTDPALRWRDGSEMLAASRTATERAVRAVPAWFGHTLSRPCTVEAVPPAEAPGAEAAYYVPPALDGGRPGTYFVNTYGARERGRHTCEATSFHEAVPGHHLQMTVAQKLTDLPLLRRLIPFGAYAEGWALYAERLADEMGLYSGDLARLGMLTKDSTRAARLVVDSGLHAKGWSRQQAVGYLRANTPLSEEEVATETDRYLAAPGQALAYMVGRLEIQHLRAEAERRLGPRFSLRGFHTAVLNRGSLPLNVLAQVVRAWPGDPPIT